MMTWALAVANSLAGVRAGARQVEVCVNGIGERAGNASLEEIVMAISTRARTWASPPVSINKEIVPTSRLVTMITGIVVQPNKAIVGANAFAHEAGIHVDGVLKQPLTYEILDAKEVGLDRNNLVWASIRAGPDSRTASRRWATSLRMMTSSVCSRLSNAWPTRKRKSTTRTWKRSSPTRSCAYPTAGAWII
jgi:isopropylmalate/homocitrate/citramalate synthase